jgi:hypothetical protein
MRHGPDQALTYFIAHAMTELAEAWLDRRQWLHATQMSNANE